MDNIIQEFEENFIRHIEKYIERLFEGDEKGISGLIKTMQQDMDKFGREALAYVLEKSDEEIMESKERKKSWNIQARDMDKTLITQFGAVKYQRTYYASKTSEDTDVNVK